jgi:hypothetical protein
MPRRLVAAATLSLLIAILAGCWGGGADVRNSNSNRSTTVGQELIDLQKAYDQGLISEREYERTRKRILRRAD